MRNPRTAQSRLSRILYLLPVCVRDGGARVDELAAALGVDEAMVLDDISELTTRPFYHPAGGGDDLQVRIVDDRVEIWTTGAFQRPPRLSPRETLALGLGLRAVAAESEPERREELLELATRLESTLAAPDVLAETEADAGVSASRTAYSSVMEEPRVPESSSDAMPLPLTTVLADEDGDIFSLVYDAAREQSVCRIRYLKAGAAAPEDRRIHPYKLAFAEGAWYILAHAEDRGAVRIFRIDRILEAERLEVGFDKPEDFDPSRYVDESGRIYSAGDDMEVAVRYAPEIARWVRERTECEPVEDGSVIVRHRVADLRWVVRHVLQYGAKAEVLEPDRVRGMVGEIAARIGG